jgi:hypothetical protein
MNVKRGVIFLSLSLVGCSGAQLTYNTIDVSTTVQDLYIKQALNNLSNIIDEPWGLPSQMDIQTGTITTANGVTPSVTFPFTGTIGHTFNSVGNIVSTSSRTASIAGSGASISGTQTWQQNWNVLPLSDANTLRNLRALYRYAVYNSDIRSEYLVPRVIDGTTLKPDFYPQCVLCTAKKLINSRLHGGWVYWTADGDLDRSHLPPPGVPTVDLGHYGTHELFMKREDYLNGYLSEFVLFILPSAEPTTGGEAGGGKSGTTTANGRVSGAPNRPNFGFPAAPVPPISNGGS